MKLEIREEKKNPLARRGEVRILIDHAGSPTPSRQEIWEAAARKLKKDRKLIIVDSIFSARARASSEAKLLVYPSEKDVPGHKLEKMKRRMRQKEEAPAAPAEPPIEEPKEAAEGEESEEGSEEEEKGSR